MSQEYITSFVIILATILPKFGVAVESEQLTALIQATITVIGGLWIMYRRYKKGDINLFGGRK